MGGKKAVSLNRRKSAAALAIISELCKNTPYSTDSEFVHRVFKAFMKLPLIDLHDIQWLISLHYEYTKDLLSDIQ